MSEHTAESDAPPCDHVAGYYANPHSGATCWDCGKVPDETNVIPPEVGQDP